MEVRDLLNLLLLRVSAFDTVSRDCTHLFSQQPTSSLGFLWEIPLRHFVLTRLFFLCMFSRILQKPSKKGFWVFSTFEPNSRFLRFFVKLPRKKLHEQLN